MLTRHRDSAPRRIEQVETVPRAVWSPAQLVAGAIGCAAIVFGAIALANTGLSTDTLFDPTATVAGYGHTPLLALSEIAFGVLMLIAAMSPAGRGAMAMLSAVLVGFGVLIVADAWPAKLHRWFDVSDRSGWLFVVVGGIGLLAAMLLPTFGGGTRVRRVRRAA
jgi:hypothetical protein